MREAEALVDALDDVQRHPRLPKHLLQCIQLRSHRGRLIEPPNLDRAVWASRGRALTRMRIRRAARDALSLADQLSGARRPETQAYLILHLNLVFQRCPCPEDAAALAFAVVTRFPMTVETAMDVAVEGGSLSHLGLRLLYYLAQHVDTQQAVISCGIVGVLAGVLRSASHEMCLAALELLEVLTDDERATRQQLLTQHRLPAVLARLLAKDRPSPTWEPRELRELTLELLCRALARPVAHRSLRGVPLAETLERLGAVLTPAEQRLARRVALLLNDFHSEMEHKVADIVVRRASVTS